jgi:hypothetical protein
MIIVDKILSMDEREIIGIAIKVEGKEYFISTQQGSWPNIRVGDHPRDYDPVNKRMVSYPQKNLITLPTDQDKVV